MKQQQQWKMNSVIGPLYLVASDEFLCGVYWTEQTTPFTSTIETGQPRHRILKLAVTQLEEYLAGKRQCFQLPLSAEGTDFQKRVWKELAAIPYGKTCSYSDIAKRLMNDKAVRAVGTANGRNPFSIIVPCHRVIAANGTLGGYAGGLSIKTRLLEIETGVSLSS